MRKIFITLTLILLPLNLVFAALATTYTHFDEPSIRTVMNYNVPKNVEGVIYYIPILLKITGQALTDETPAGSRTVTITSEVGVLAETKKTPQEIYTLLGADYLQSAYADFYNQALSQNIIP